MTGAASLVAAMGELGYSNVPGMIDERSIRDRTAKGFLWRELGEKCGAQSAFFRGGVPLVAFASTSIERPVQALRSRLWNFGRVPILIAENYGSLAVFSCYVAPTATSDSETGLLATVPVGGDIRELLRDFSRLNVESGAFTRRNPGAFKSDQRVNRHLLESLRRLRAKFDNRNFVQSAVDQLIGRSIFVRFMEDRSILSSEHIRELVPFDDFLSVLESGRLQSLALFKHLSERFNGDVFSVAESERSNLTDFHYRTVASFFRGEDQSTGQQTFWPYDFSIIPPELVSSIYEQLLEDKQRDDSAYYTPRHLVDTMLDETVRWEATTPSPQILDPACGSGIFLTEAYRRLAFGLASETDDARSVEVLSELLTSSIFGVDRNEEAARVATFGLYLALLSEVDPPTAWMSVKLPNLIGRNILVADFFSPKVFVDREFDVIIGNPPWRSELTTDAASYIRHDKRPVADKQIATAFLWRALDFLKPGGVIAFLMPAKPLLHNTGPKAISVRDCLLEQLDLESVINLAPIRHDLFSKASGPGAILVGRKPLQGELRTKDDILYAITRSSPLQSSLDCLVIATDDVHRIRVVDAQEHPDIWKVLLWGDASDVQMVRRLRENYQTLGQLKKRYGWEFGHGYQLRGQDRNDSSELVGMKLVEAEHIQPLVRPEFGEVTSTIMHRPRNVALYRGPHVLIRVGFHNQLPAATFLAEDTAFPHGIIGLAGRDEYADLLAMVAVIINSTIGRYFQFMTSASWGAEREFVEVSEHLSLPIPDWNGEPSRLLRELVSKVRRGIRTNQHTIDHAVASAFNLSEDENFLIEETMASRFDQFVKKAKSSAFKMPTQDVLKFYRQRLTSFVHAALPSVRVKTQVTEIAKAYSIVSATLSEATDDSRSRVNSAALGSVAMDESLDDTGLPSVVIQRSMIVVSDNQVSLFKPSERRFWTGSRARADAIEIVAAILTLPVTK